jgi:hypothetical protein
VESRPPSSRPEPRPLERVWGIVDLALTAGLVLAAVWAILTGRATEPVVAVLWIAFRGLSAARRRGR